MQAEIRRADVANFPALDRFAKYKSEGQLSLAEDVAEKVFYFLNHSQLFPDVVQDVRNFEFP